MNVHQAAAALYRSIPAPTGALNTLAYADDRGPFIRVLVDPAATGEVPVPATFEGYRIVVETRQPGTAQDFL